MMRFPSSTFMVGMCGGVLALSVGCGLIADKDRIVIARIGEETITRGDLNRWLRDQPDDERPNIGTKEDVRNAMKTMIERQIQGMVLDEMLASRAIYSNFEGPAPPPNAVYFPREIVERAYYKKHPEHEVRVEDPAVLGLDEFQYQGLLDAIETAIDREERRILGEVSIELLVGQGYEAGMLKLTDEELAAAYEREKDNLKKFEVISFDALVYPVTDPDAIDKAGADRRALDAGTPFDELVPKHVAARTFVRSGIENNPALEKFRGFWQQSSGAKVGDVIGPVLLPAAEFMIADERGGVRPETFPDVYLIFQVVEQFPERQKTLEEARQDLMYPVLYDKQMALLYDKYDVKVFDDKLPDPQTAKGGK